MINKATIQRINDEARVEDVVGEFVTLKRRGSNLLGLCPFHNEKTPSFNVNPARNIYKCFGCGKAGGPIQFLIDYQQLSYPDALKYLAKKYNIEIEEEYTSDEDKQREIEQHNLVESIHIANASAQKFYTDYMLHNEEGRVGLAYFKERGFLTNTIEKFQLGYAPDKGDAFTKYALNNGFQLDVLKKAGLTSPKEGSTYDFFRNRVMFPIHNTNGKIVGFGGRTLVTDKKIPKYVNTAESEVYEKSKILYGGYFAKAAIRKADECLLVEGYTDVISLHQNNVENVVASSGTSLTLGQVQFIKRITSNVTILYDGDSAGIKAALRGMNIILEQNMTVGIVLLPTPEDPDSYIRKVGHQGFVDFVKENKKDFILFITALYAEEAGNDPAKKTKFFRELIESISYIPDTLKRGSYLKRCSEMFSIDEQSLITETNKIKYRREEPERLRKQIEEIDKRTSKGNTQQGDKIRQQKERIEEQIQNAENIPLVDLTFRSVSILERDIIRVMLEYGAWEIPVDENMITVNAYIIDELEGLELETPEYKLIYDEIRSELEQGNKPDDKYFTTHPDKTIADTSIDLLTRPFSLSANWWDKYKVAVPEKQTIYVKDVQSAVLRFKQYRNIVELDKVTKLIEKETDEAELFKLLKLKKLLDKQKTEFARDIGNVIYRPLT